MPIYEYQCSDCGDAFEKLIRFSDPNQDTPGCPTCQSNNTHKKLSAIAAIHIGNQSGAASSSCGTSGPFR